MLPGLDLYYTDPAQPLTAAGEELDDLDNELDNELSDLYVPGTPRVHTTLRANFPS